MTGGTASFLLGLGVALSASGAAQAFLCSDPANEPMLVIEGVEPTEADRLRNNSRALAQAAAGGRVETDIIVLGRFTRTNDAAFYRLDQLEEMRNLYWPGDPAIEMPARVEFTYLEAYRFDGMRLSGTGFVPFTAEAIDAHTFVLAEYEGTAGSLPMTEVEVFGRLYVDQRTGRLEISSLICPTYHEISPAQREDLVACYLVDDCE